MLKLTLRTPTPADAAAVNELLQSSYLELMSFWYDTGILVDPYRPPWGYTGGVWSV